MILLKRRRWSKGHIVMLLYLGLLMGACKADEEALQQIPETETTDGPVQYGQPFEHVPTTSEIIMYEINLQAFSASGDIEGVRARLDEIKALNVNVIWLMPIHPIGELRGIGSPYAVQDYMEVRSQLGSLEDLRRLVAEAHERDIAVILDLVANHTSWDNPWMENPNWYTRDGAGNIISPPGTGWDDVADLNYLDPNMRSEMIKVMKYWVLEANVDGYRCDYANGVPTDFWQQAIDSLRSIPNRDVIMFAEAVQKDLFGAGFDLTFGWDFYHRLKEVVTENAPAANLIRANETDYHNVPEGSHILRWIDNHDDNAWNNTPINIFQGLEGKLAAFAVTAYMGGVPLIYNGQEVGFPQRIPFFDGNDVKIDWSLNPDVLAQYQQLLAFRESSNAVGTGGLEVYEHNDVVAFKRIAGGEEVLVLVNLRNEAIDYSLPAAIAGTTWVDAMDGNDIHQEENMLLAPCTYMILKQ